MQTQGIEDVYPLSPMQQGMLLYALGRAEDDPYLVQFDCVLRGDLNVDAFERAWQRVIQQHSVLRTAFFSEGLDEPVQVVHRSVEFKLERHDWRDSGEQEQAERLRTLLEEDRKRGLDLATAPLMRITLVRTGADTWYFVWTHHHIIIDGWSLPPLFGQLFACYSAFCGNRQPQLEAATPFSTYIGWLQRQSPAAAESFWRNRLSGFASPTPLPGERADGGTWETTEGRLSERATSAIDDLCRGNALTLNTVLQGAWAIVLSRYSGCADVLFGSTVSGRPADLPGAERMVGLFINTVPVRVAVDGARPAIDWLRELQEDQTAAREYEYCSLVDIQGWTEVPRGVPLFESLFVFENYPADAMQSNDDAGLRIENVHSPERTNYPLTIVSGPGTELRIKIAHDLARFTRAAIERMLDHLCAILEEIADQPRKPLGELQMLKGAARRQVLVEWNETEALVSARSFPELFDRQVARHRDDIAVVFGGRRLTYGELDSRANRLAHRLEKLGVGPEKLVGIAMERSLEMVVAIVGVFKAGAAYLPLDPGYPPQRLSFLVSDSGAQLLLTQRNLLPRLAGTDAATLCLDTDWRLIEEESDLPPAAQPSPQNLAYVIYTSGSTGTPKGVMVSHGGLANYLAWCEHAYPLKSGRGAPVSSSFAFDLTITALLAPLACGSTVELLSEEKGVEALSDALRQLGGYSLVKITPAHLQVLGQQLTPGQAAQSTNAFIIGGENLRTEHIAFWQRHAPGAVLVNEYGPTETVVGCCVYQAAPGETFDGVMPIGKPIINTQLYVLDRNLEPLPPGVAGELYIGGAQVARGYLNRTELTADRFVPDPFSSMPGARLYRSGDLVRFRADGNLECLGRVDDQVKIRGFRIELGEIEAALGQHPGVRDVAVAVRDDRGERELIAYCVPSGDTLDTAGLRTYLRERMPEYMVPATFVAMPSLPLTSHGKVDRKALPAPDQEQPKSAAGRQALRKPAEELAAGIFAQVLRLDCVGRDDNFFDLGGHSILAMQMISRAREAFGREIPLRYLFDHPTPAGLAARIEEDIASGDAAGAIAFETLPDGVTPPLSFAQERLWFLDQLEPGSPFYNNPALARLTGRLDSAAMERALNEIVCRHEVLRTSFRTEDGRPVPVVDSDLRVALPVEDLRRLPVLARGEEMWRQAREEAVKPFDLGRPPLLRARLWKLDDDEHMLLLVMHHILCDGWSNSVLLSEMAALYTAFSSGAPSPLPPLRYQYSDYAAWQRRRLQGPALESQLDYWKNQLAGMPPMLELPADRARPPVVTFRGAQQPFEFSQALTEGLRRLSRQENATLFMTLLAGFQALLARYTRQQDIAVGTAVANRDRAEVEPLIGFFINTLVLRTDLSGDPSFRDLTARVRETALGAYAHQDLPFEMLVEALQPERNLSHSPLFQVMLTLNNTPASIVEAPGLKLESLAADSGTARFDLTLELSESSERIAGWAEYNTDLFDGTTIERLLDHWQRLLEAAVADPEQHVSELPVLSETEHASLTAGCNRTECPYPSENVIHEVFEQQAAKTPGGVAVQANGVQVSYAELDRHANQLARYLRNRGVGPDVIVGLLLERSVDLVVAVLGVLKAGGAYLPLDPAYPPDRLAWMLRDSEAPLLITSRKLEALASGAGRVIDLESELAEIEREDTAPVANIADPKNLAYVIYTSGSTGRPKGAMLQHRGLCNLAAEQGRVFGIVPGSRVLQFAPFSFDASVWETFMALANGGTLCLAPAERAAMDELRSVLRGKGITTVTLPPSVLAALDAGELPGLTTVIAAGEACGRQLVSKWAPGRRFFNAYGPTETTVCASMALANASEAADPPIGTPLANMQLYVLDGQLEPVPVGVPGELYVGGAGLARGYLRRPEKTAESFVPNPFSDHPGARLYRTGDLVRRRADNQVEFLGRIDQQTKVRGYRVEPGEIEAALASIEGVREAAVIVHSQQLVAYVAGEDVPPAAQLQARLRQTLPEYMVPSRFIAVEAMPLNPSGKVDRSKLPAPEAAETMRRTRVAPRTDAERKLAAIWADILGVAEVGAEDNFFELGGHSLLATQVASRIRQGFGVELALRALFENPALDQLAKQIEALQAAGSASSGPELVAIPRRERRLNQSAMGR